MYGIIGTEEAGSFGSIGIGGRGDPVTTIAYRDLSAVVSSVPMDNYMAGLGPMLSHQRVLEKVMKEHTLLPMRFYTVAPTAHAVRGLLRVCYRQFKQLLRELDSKVELGLKAQWKDIDQMLGRSSPSTLPAPGGLTAPPARQGMWLALDKRRTQVREVLLQPLRPLTAGLCLNRTGSDDIIMNAAFLIDRSREGEFDAQVGQLSDRFRDTIQFRYVGPVPPYSFVNILVREHIPAVGPQGERRR